MKERIDEVLAAEKEAEELLAGARRRADEIRQAAETEAADAARAAREQAEADTRAAVERAEREADERSRREIAAAEAEGDAALAANRAGMDQLVDRLVALVARPRHKARGWSTGDVERTGKARVPGRIRRAKDSRWPAASRPTGSSTPS